MAHGEHPDATRLWVAPVFGDSTATLGSHRRVAGQARGEEAEGPRVEDPWLFTIETILTPGGDSWLDGLHSEHELVWASAGALTVERPTTSCGPSHRA